MANSKHLQHKRSCVVDTTNGSPKLPTSGAILYGEIAVNYAKDNETLSLRNSADEVIALPNNKSVSAIASAYTEELRQEIKPSLSSATINSKEATFSEDKTSFSINVSGSDTNVGDYETVEYPEDFKEKAENVSGDNTISEAFNAVETTVANLTEEVLKNELVTAKGFEKVGDACGILNDDDEIQYIQNTNAHYISGATSLANADDILDEAINDLKSNIPSFLDGYATENWVENQGYAKGTIPTISVSQTLTSGTEIGKITINGIDTELYCTNSSQGSTVSITREKTSGDKIATLTIDGNDTELYCNTTTTYTGGDNIKVENGTITVTGITSSPFIESDGAIYSSLNHCSASGTGAFAVGIGTAATDEGAFAEGIAGQASGKYSHVEGSTCAANSEYGHAEGFDTNSTAMASHAEGGQTNADGEFSHSEGYNTTANGKGSHAEGYSKYDLAPLIANGDGAHVGGYCDYYFTDDIIPIQANGKGSFAHGIADTQHTIQANGTSSFAMGCSSVSDVIAYGSSSFAMGNGVIASGDTSYASGLISSALTYNSFVHGEGVEAKTYSGETAFGRYNVSNNNTFFSIGNGTSETDRKNILYLTSGGSLNITDTYYGKDVKVSGNISANTISASTIMLNGETMSPSPFESNGYGIWATVGGGSANPVGAFAIGGTANGRYSVALGYNTIAQTDYSVAMGSRTTTSGTCSVALGKGTTAGSVYEEDGSEFYNNNAFAMGDSTFASGECSVALGYNTVAQGECSFAEGYANKSESGYIYASGVGSHAGGYCVEGDIEAQGNGSFAFGHSTIQNGIIIANGRGSVAFGCANGNHIKSTNDGSFAGGNAYSDNIVASGLGSFAFGITKSHEINALGEGSVAIGVTNNFQLSAESDGSFAFGNTISDEIIANGDGSFAGGVGASTNSTASFAFGDGAHASGHCAVALGYNTTVEGECSFAMGEGLETSKAYEVAFGIHNMSDDDTLFSIGYGEGSPDEERKNYFEVTTDNATYVGDLYYSTSQQRSDRRLKENISSINEADIEKVKNVNLQEFNFINDEAKTKKYGIIAQDLEEVGLNNLVKESKGNKSVDYISFLILKIQQLEKEIEELKNK